MKRIALIEDDRSLLKRLSFFLNKQKELTCIIVANSLGEFFERLDEEMKPDLLLLDIELSENINTIAHLQKIKSLLPRMKILVITGHNHPSYLFKALEQGADSFYLKGSGLPKLLEAIEATFSGGAYLDPKAAAQMIPLLRNKKKSPEARGDITPPGDDGTVLAEGPGLPEWQLTSREQQVARGLVEGKSYKEVAAGLNLSVNTVRHYVKVLYKKLKVANKIQLSNKLKRYL
ncbi:MAG: response regulator transcription factor [Lewinellaceae bacterium]|nr:response regulator transcription factor [Lewinellaceae bacterium]MCB9286181.1 response regulator transcription factor [Lewinellaceae bacterium]